MWFASTFIAICLLISSFLSIDIAPRLYNACWSLLDTQLLYKPTKAEKTKPPERLLLCRKSFRCCHPVPVLNFW